MDQQIEGSPQYIHVNQNDFSYRKHKKQKEEDIAICECKYDADNPESTCGERCLNVLTSTECTPGYCPCGFYCKNQRFQKCEYAKTKLFRTEGRGWGLLADENIKAGCFIIEYCGEVISWKEAKRRSQTYETQGLKDAYIISLNAHESIDATKKGSLARFINHSCQPNCETRKWTVLGEIRVGIFSKQDISVGTELAYDYNFEWYGGAKVRCLCGAASCPGFLGAKSRGFQEDTYLWEDDDDRYSVEKIPLYDSEEDEPSSKLLKIMDSSKSESLGSCEYSTMMDVSVGSEHQFESTALVVKQLDSIPVEGAVLNVTRTEVGEERKLYSQDTQQSFSQTNAMISRIRSNSACRNYHIGPGPVPKKRTQHISNGRSKFLAQKQVDPKHVAQLLASKAAQDEVFKCEDTKNHVTSKLDSLYNEIRPAIEEHERDSQDSVPTTVAEKWIEASCLKLKAEFDLYSSIIKNVACTPRRAWGEAKPSEGDNENEPISTKCSFVVESALVMDYTSEFTTYEIFKSRETLCMWAREVGRKNGFVVVVLRSDVTNKGHSPRLTLGCERGGVYRENKKRLAIANTKQNEPKLTRTKKCGCPFKLKGTKMPCNDEWMLSVVNGVHNHGPGEHFEGHSYAGRLTSEESELVVDMSKSMARPKDILATIKRKDEDNVSTLRTIYNARARYRMGEKAGRSQIQYLLGKLEEFKYSAWHRSMEGTDELIDLFWAHPHSIQLFCAFPRVLIMDCTYKTNNYRLPLLEIVGVTSTNLTFSVAFVYLQSERVENYTWALSRLKSVMDDNNVMPSVFVTDRELALMKAIETVFPNANHMLCRWHISKNILAKCKRLFESKDKFDKFMAAWSVLTQSETEHEYDKHVTQLRDDFSRYPQVLEYVASTWLVPYRERFVTAWTDKIKHYGNATTNRVESAHAKLKRVLGCSTNNFETSWPQIHNLLELQHTTIKASFEKSLTVVQHHFRDPLLAHLRGAISIFALDNIVSQFSVANTNLVSSCGCENRQIYGLPCGHEIADYIRQSRPIPLDSIDPHWRKLDIHPVKKPKEVLKSHCLTTVDLNVKQFDEMDSGIVAHAKQVNENCISSKYTSYGA